MGGFAPDIAPKAACARRGSRSCYGAPTGPRDRRDPDRPAGGRRRPDRGEGEHPAGLRRHAGGPGPRAGRRAADRDGVARTCRSRRTSAAGSTGSACTRPTEQPKHDEGPKLLAVGAEAGRPAHRARHQRDEPVHVAEPVRADRRAVRRDADPDRHGLRPVHRPRPRRADLRAVHQERSSSSPGRRRACRWRPEGGAHQSTVTPSLGIELPLLHFYEPTFGQEVVWSLLEGDARLRRPPPRLLDLPADVDPPDRPGARRPGPDAPRRGRVAAPDAGRRLPADRGVARRRPSCRRTRPIVQIVATGAIVPEADRGGATYLQKEEVAANVIVVTSAQRLFADLHDRRLGAIRDRTPGSARATSPPCSRRASVARRSSR